MLIDRKNIINNIKTRLLSLLNTHWNIKNSFAKQLPDSTVIFSTNISHIIDAINNIPTHRTVASKQSIVSDNTENCSIVAYGNHSRDNIQKTTYPSSTDVPVFINDENLNVLDARVSGGGVTKQYVNDSFGTDLFMGGYTDIGRYDGTPVAATASTLIELPSIIKTNFTEKQIQYIVNKFLASGVHPVISYYDGPDSLSAYNWILSDVKAN